jgi:hypothetical protein
VDASQKIEMAVLKDPPLQPLIDIVPDNFQSFEQW